MANNRMRLFLAGVLLFTLTSCSFGLDFSATEQTYYTIVEKPAKPVPSAEQFAMDVIIQETRSSAFLSGRKIVFGETPQTRGYYQFAAWTEPLPSRFSALLTQSLRASRLFRSVAKSTSAARGDIEILTELVDAYHASGSSPGSVHFELEVDILESRTGNILGHNRFVKDVPVPSYDAAGAVAGISEAAYNSIDEIIAWTKTTLEKNNDYRSRARLMDSADDLR